MTNADLIDKLARDHNLTSGRAEMILSIIVERITEKLISDGNVKINELGEFTVIKNSLSAMIMTDNLLNKNRVVFSPGKQFLETINSM